MKTLSIEENSRLFREFMKNQLFRILVRSITHLETLDDGLTPAEIWIEVNNLLSELRSVDKCDREVMLSQFYVNYYHRLSELERNGKTINLSEENVNRTVTCIFYCLQLRLEESSTNRGDNPNQNLIDAISQEINTINHPILDNLRKGINNDKMRYKLHTSHNEPDTDPLEEKDEDWNEKLRRVFTHYARKMERYLVKHCYEPFFLLWDKLADDVQISEQMKVPSNIKGDEHKELKVNYNAKLLFNIYGILFRRGCFQASIKGETPLSVLVSEHYDAETHVKVKARYEYFKPESVGIKPQFLGLTATVHEHLVKLIEKIFPFTHPSCSGQPKSYY